MAVIAKSKSVAKSESRYLEIAGNQIALPVRRPLPFLKLKHLYSDEKKSVPEIAPVFGCSEHKVNYWLGKYHIKKRTISEAMYLKLNPKGDPFQIKPIKTLKDAKLLGLGLGLYWGEGNKRNKNSVRLGNTDPKLIKVFLEFLVRLFDIDKHKLRFGLQIFSDMSKERVLQFWLDELKPLGIQKEQFFKLTVTPTRGIGNYKEKSKFGVLTINFGNSKLKRIIDSLLPT